MKTFEEVMELTRTVSSNAAFEDDECKAYYNVLMSLPKGSGILEIGLEYGRSSSIALRVAKEKGFVYNGIDPFHGNPEIYEAWVQMAEKTGASFTVWKYESKDAPAFKNIDAVLIDGDHSYDGVLSDCRKFLPAVIPGGYAMFHDFMRDSLPDVERAVADYFSEVGLGMWTCAGFAGTLYIWRKFEQGIKAV